MSNINIIINNMVKKVISITIDEKILSTWKNYVDEDCVNSSKLIERLMDLHLKKRRVKK